MMLFALALLFFLNAAGSSPSYAQSPETVETPEPKKSRFEFQINKQWDGVPVHKSAAVKINLEGIGTWLRLEVQSPFYNDTPPPNGKYGKPYPELYNYEVVEAFFLNDKNQYLEVELGPHGQHLVLMLNGRRNIVVQQLPLQNIAEIKGDSWRGIAYIENGYFPPNITKFNAYSIHGNGDNRTYNALHPTPKGQFERPDFHRLDYFQPISLNHLPPFKESTVRKPNLWDYFPSRQ